MEQIRYQLVELPNAERRPIALEPYGAFCPRHRCKACRRAILTGINVGHNIGRFSGVKTVKPTSSGLMLSFAIAACAIAFGTPVPPAAAAPTAPAGATAPANKAVSSEGGIAWFKGDVDAAFVAAKADNRPVFLYWGAVWCPPCNQVKATIFNRQDFIERSRFFVPVYIDGDAPSAQRLGTRFKVSGYPTMILLKPDGSEITRLPGEVDAEQYMRVLNLGMNGARPVKETLAAALSPSGSKLTPEDWRMLSYYSWETDEQQLLSKDALASTLQRVARACPPSQPETAARLELRMPSRATTPPRRRNSWRCWATPSSRAKISTCWSITRARSRTG
jgi:thioredoxin-related protein